MGPESLGAAGDCPQLETAPRMMINSVAISTNQPRLIRECADMCLFSEDRLGDGLNCCFFEGYSCVLNNGPSPESNAENASEGQEEKCQSGTQSEVVADAADDKRNNRAPHDSCAQNAGEGSVIFRYRIQGQRNQDRPHHRGEQADRWKSYDSNI